MTKVEERFSCELIKKIQNSNNTIQLTEKEKHTIIIALAMWNAIDNVLDTALGLKKEV